MLEKFGSYFRDNLWCKCYASLGQLSAHLRVIIAVVSTNDLPFPFFLPTLLHIIRKSDTNSQSPSLRLAGKLTFHCIAFTKSADISSPAGSLTRHMMAFLRLKETFFTSSVCHPSSIGWAPSIPILISTLDQKLHL